VLTTATLNRLRSSTRRAASRSGIPAQHRRASRQTTTPSSWRPAGWRENFGSATTSCSRSPTTARAAS
jgi:hypothetical protein